MSDELDLVEHDVTPPGWSVWESRTIGGAVKRLLHCRRVVRVVATTTKLIAVVAVPRVRVAGDMSRDELLALVKSRVENVRG